MYNWHGIALEGSQRQFLKNPYEENTISGSKTMP